MQKNLPKYAPDWIATTPVWSFASQAGDHLPGLRRPAHAAVVRQPARRRVPRAAVPDRRRIAHLPGARPRPAGGRRLRATSWRPPRSVRQALADSGLAGRAQDQRRPRACTSMVPLADGTSGRRRRRGHPRARRPGRARRSRRRRPPRTSRRSGRGRSSSTPPAPDGATVVAAYSPRIRPGVPVSFPVDWDDARLGVTPADFTVRTAARAARRRRSRGATRMPAPQALPADLVEEGHTIPVARVVAMHEGKRRKRAAGG